MPEKKIHFAIRLKIWIEDESGNVIFGEGRYRILEAIDRLHSLQAAAKELKMGYRAVWGRIKASEKRMGKPLVARDGKGSRLTPFAEELMLQYRKLQTRINDESHSDYAALFADYLEK
jgi:molybdate transport system regulatory protein